MPSISAEIVKRMMKIFPRNGKTERRDSQFCKNHPLAHLTRKKKGHDWRISSSQDGEFALSRFIAADPYEAEK
jgi:hypothetical protein